MDRRVAPTRTAALHRSNFSVSKAGRPPAHFDLYQADLTSVTSTLFTGGDWHWRLISDGGLVLVDCGGYRTHSDALIVVETLRNEAAGATLFTPSAYLNR